jgi:aminoglycoside phosphotransferase
MSSASSTTRHLNDSIRQVDHGTWLISDKLLLTRSSRPHAGCEAASLATWGDSNGGHFTLAPAPDPLPDSTKLAEASPSVFMVHSVDNQAATWRAGEAFIKGHRMDYPHVTREHVTLEFLRRRQPRGFAFPRVIHHFEDGPRYFLVVSRVPGQLLDQAWPRMDEARRQHYVDRVARVCHGLAQWKGQSICGVDGRHLFERFLIRGGSTADDALAPQQLRRNCADMAMDVSNLVFYHCDLGPMNLLVDPATGALGIIDWELAGYVPVEWVGTKFRLSAGMDLSGAGDDVKRDWRLRVSRHLEGMGYRSVVGPWCKFHGM